MIAPIGASEGIIRHMLRTSYVQGMLIQYVKKGDKNASGIFLQKGRCRGGLIRLERGDN